MIRVVLHAYGNGHENHYIFENWHKAREFANFVKETKYSKYIMNVEPGEIHLAREADMEDYYRRNFYE